MRDRLAISSTSKQKLSYAELLELTKRADVLGRPLLLKDLANYLEPEAFEKIHELRSKKFTGFSSHFVNSYVDLSEELKLSHSTRKNYKRSTEYYGLNVSINRTDELEKIYKLHLDTRKRLRVAPYPKTFFKTLNERVGKNTTLFLCYQNKELLGFLICYLHKSEIISAHLGYDFNSRHKRVTDLLFLSALNWGKLNGFKLYRFGADHKSQTGLIHFKKRFGAQCFDQLDFHINSNIPVSSEKKLANIGRFIGILPDYAYKYLGEITRFYLS